MLRTLVAVAAVTAAFTAGCGQDSSDSPSDRDSVRGRVVRVVDGDTLIVRDDTGEVRVRVLGIDTPESVKPGTAPECGASRAAASLRSLAPAGAAVKLTTNPDSGDVRDRYGRLLAFVSIAGHDLGLQQLRRGWAEVYTYRDRKFTGRDRYEHAYRQADRQNRGVHRLCSSDFHHGGP